MKPADALSYPRCCRVKLQGSRTSRIGTLEWSQTHTQEGAAHKVQQLAMNKLLNPNSGNGKCARHSLSPHPAPDNALLIYRQLVLDIVVYSPLSILTSIHVYVLGYSG